MMCHATKSSVVKEEGNEKRLLGKHGFNRYQISFFPLVTVYLLINLPINSTITAGGYADGKFSAGFKKHVLPPVGVWTVSQFQCGGPSSQNPY